MKAMWTVVLMLAVCASAFALAPAKMSYQGVLTDGAGAIVADGDYDLTLALYDVETGGVALWTEAQTAAVAGGVFNVVLGGVSPLTLPFDKAYYLGVAVEGGGELVPRTLLTSAAYSLNAPVVAFGASGNTTDLTTAGWTNYEDDTVSIDCPGPGYVNVQSSVWMQIYHDAGSSDRFYLAHGRTPTESPDDYAYVASHSVPGGAPAATYDMTLPVQSVFPVTAAGPVTFYLNGQKASGTSTIHFWYANTVATWYPGTLPVPTLQQMPQPMKSMPVGR